MKIRNGFVSNSSSSSFMVLMKDENLKMSIQIDLRKSVDNIISTKEELDLITCGDHNFDSIEDIYVKDKDDCYLYDYELNKYLKLLNYIEQGYKIGMGTWYSDDCGIGEFMCQVNNSQVTLDSKENVYIGEND